MRAVLTSAILSLLLGSGCGEDLSAGAGGDPDCEGMVLFRDGATGYESCNVLDIDGNVVRFVLASGELVWAATGDRFEDFPVFSGYVLGPQGQYQVSFGFLNGKHWAWITGSLDGRICDVELSSGGLLSILPTDVEVPQEDDDPSLFLPPE